MASLLSSSLAKSLINQKLAKVYIEPLGGSKDDKATTQAFQYWPESISDSQSSNYASMDIPGASLPLYQFISLGERSVSFTVYFSRDEDGEFATPGAPSFDKVEENKHNVDICAAIAWLRSLQYPAYPSGTYVPPHILKLYIPNVKLSPNGADDCITCILTQISVNWMSFFPSGVPRIATADLTFAEIPYDEKTGIKFRGRKDWREMLKDKYNVTSK